VARGERGGKKATFVGRCKMRKSDLNIVQVGSHIEREMLAGFGLVCCVVVVCWWLDDIQPLSSIGKLAAIPRHRTGIAPFSSIPSIHSHERDSCCFSSFTGQQHHQQHHQQQHQQQHQHNHPRTTGTTRQPLLRSSTAMRWCPW